MYLGQIYHKTRQAENCPLNTSQICFKAKLVICLNYMCTSDKWQGLKNKYSWWGTFTDNKVNELKFWLYDQSAFDSWVLVNDFLFVECKL